MLIAAEFYSEMHLNNQKQFFKALEDLDLAAAQNLLNAGLDIKTLEKYPVLAMAEAIRYRAGALRNIADIPEALQNIDARPSPIAHQEYFLFLIEAGGNPLGEDNDGSPLETLLHGAAPIFILNELEELGGWGRRSANIASRWNQEHPPYK